VANGIRWAEALFDVPYSPFVIHSSNSRLAPRQVGVDWPARRHYYLLDTHAWSPIVLAKPRLVLVFAGLICFTLASTPHGALAATAEVAKKCSALTAKVFPPRVIGNPGAGSAKGDGLAEQAYFKKCVASGGKVEDDGAHD
jgi:hypothetical protein